MKETKEELVTPEGESGKKAKKKGGKKKLLIILGIVVVVLAVAVVAGLQWHEQPSFCGQVCHKVMSIYVEDWESGGGLAQAHADAGAAELVTAKVAYPEGIECLDCHEPTISQQIEELTMYVSGDYEVPMEFRQIGTSEFCEECHDYEAVTALTENWGGEEGVNPHASHNGKLDCFNCHKMHLEESTLYCNQCHNLEVPEGWEGSE